MNVNGTNLTIKRGETFTVDFSFTNKDDSPFIVSSELTHPYLLFSVVSNSFATENAYEYNVWCDLRKYYRFKSTTAIEINNINSFDVATYPDVDTDANGRQYCNDCVFKCKADGKYYVYKYESQDGAGDAGYYEYELRLVLGLDSDVTAQWSSQTYTYSISLVESEEEVTSDVERVSVVFNIPLLEKATIYVAANVGGNN